MELVLYEPEIPPNTGNIARLSIAYGVVLNLIQPLGFSLDDRYLKRAGCDYWPRARLRLWPDWRSFAEATPACSRLIMISTKGATRLPDFQFADVDYLVFGPESRGLPAAVMAASPYSVRLPMIPAADGGCRSLNLSTCAGIVLYAALLSSGQMARFC